MQVAYQKIIDFVLLSGKRLAERTGKIKDIGISKTDLTEEDLAIERGLKEIISGFSSGHVIYAEEENDLFQKSENLWVVDPISGTANFIQGLPHYSIVVSHLFNHQAVFACVFDPSVNELFTAFEGKGAFLNGKPIHVSSQCKKLILRPSMAWKDPEAVEKTEQALKDFELENNRYSMAVNYCAVAAGRVDGVVSFTKDTFPEFAGAFMVKEAGGKFTNLQGQTNILATDRVFVGGNIDCYEKIFSLVKHAVVA